MYRLVNKIQIEIEPEIDPKNLKSSDSHFTSALLRMFMIMIIYSQVVLMMFIIMILYSQVLFSVPKVFSIIQSNLAVTLNHITYIRIYY